MKIKTITLDKLNLMYSHNYVYDNERLSFAPADKYGLASGDTACKEEIGLRCVIGAHSAVVVNCGRKMTDKEIKAIRDTLHAREKRIKVRRTKIMRVKRREKWLYFRYSPKWCKNSVAHSIYMTWLRVAINEHRDNAPSYVKGIDRTHLLDANPVIRAVLKNGMRVFAPVQQKDYDVGMVSFIYRFADGQFDTPFRESNPQPQREDFEYEWEYFDALDDWENENYWHDDYDYGDLDRPIPKNHAYKKLVKILKK